MKSSRTQSTMLATTPTTHLLMINRTPTCFHVHTKILPTSPEGAETLELTPEKNTSKKRPSGNRAAVRKYREKKKAHTAYLEEEMVHSRALNQQLTKKLQNHAALEAEVARLRCLLIDIRGRIEGEIGDFPYHSLNDCLVVPRYILQSRNASDNSW
jgi:hypothetical protein